MSAEVPKEVESKKPEAPKKKNDLTPDTKASIEKEKQDAREKAVQKLSKLDSSDISKDLRQMIQEDIRKMLAGESKENLAEFDKDAKGKTYSLAQLTDGWADLYLRNNPNMQQRFERGEVNALHLCEIMFDQAFSKRLNDKNVSQKYDKILEKYKSIN